MTAVSPATLRELLSRDEPIVAPGAYDALGAMLIERAGFPAAYMSGAATSVSLGLPDYGLLTMSEMVDNAASLARSVSIPVIADADTGYGSELNVTRTVRAYEAAGVAAIHLEDQVMPKRCGHLDGKQVVDRSRFVSLIEAAVAARRSDDFVIIARTDAAATHGLDEAIERANAALSAGADMAFVEAVSTLEEASAVPRRVHGPCMLNLVGGGKTPVRGMAEAAEMGYKLVIFPVVLLAANIDAMQRSLTALHESGECPIATLGVHDIFDLVGAAEWDTIRD
jgi:2-methylisocitrate lyase-like PEP mutase family enzyme